MRAKIFILMMLIAAAAIPAHAQQPADASNDPMASVKNVIDQAIAVFKDQGLAPDVRTQKLRAVAQDHFDFAKMARYAVGMQWRDFTPQQRDQFVPVFTGFIEDIYLSRIQEYSVEKVRQDIQSSSITFLKERIDGDEAEVFSTVLIPDREQPLAVNYRMSRESGQWRIYDITLDGISVIANYRTQFNRVLNQGGYDRLLAALQQKQQALNSSIQQ